MKLIYILRAQCEPCKLDKMITFYRPNKTYVLDENEVPQLSTPSNLYHAHELQLTKRFKTKYHCEHPITFTHEIDKEYKWDEKLNQPVARV